MEAVQVYCCSRPDCRIFPNRTGVAKYGKRRVPFGLTKSGSADLIGWITINDVAVFLAIEIKVGRDTTKPAQRNFIDRVVAAGGIASVVRSVEEVEMLLPKVK
jgi:hypothetical protein